MPLAPLAPLALATLLLCGCIVVPRSTEVYDPQCRTMVRQMVLDAAVVGPFGHCHDEGCGAMLAAMGLVGAASAVISGSVAVIGNIVYWIERKGRCPPAPMEAAPPPAVPLPAGGAAPSAAPAASAPASSRAPHPPRPPVVPGMLPLPATPGASSPP